MERIPARDDVVISVGVIIGLVKLVLVVWRIAVIVVTEKRKWKERRAQKLKKCWTLGDNIPSNGSYASYDDTRGPTVMNTVDYMPGASTYQPTTSLYNPSISLRANNNSSYFMLMGEQIEMTSLKRFRINHLELKPIEELAKGGYGEVWRGTYQGRTVAIKTLVSTKEQTLEDVHTFVNEIRLMVELVHPNICQVVGACWMDSGDIKMVLEYMSRGDLKTYLATVNPSLCGWDDKCLLALDIIEGLVFIHERNIIHRDLKSRNVLLHDTDDLDARRVGAKLTDFGLSRKIENDNESMSCGVGTYRWMAPEVFLGTHYTTAVDVYSFGMILSELDSHQVPFFDLRNEDGQVINEVGIQDKVRRGLLQPKFSSSCPVGIETLALKCVAFDPTDRPTAHDVLMTLRQYLDSSLFES
ncbi:hypothetical protein AC1031_009271 [Aphanomyces cochlioides]|nr:hypothetical protein AC1031_009271 [Aphanomyces cochlioides]